MRVVLILLGTFFFAMGAWGFSHPQRSPEASGGWMSFPGGRRVGGVLTMLVGAVLVAGTAYV